MTIRETATRPHDSAEVASGHLADIFEEAAWQLPGGFDTPEQQMSRALRARQLGQKMRPGEPVLQKSTQLEVCAGTLIESPTVVRMAQAGKLQPAISYKM